MMTKKEFADGWKHFCNCIDFVHSNLDSEAIYFGNIMPSEVMIGLTDDPQKTVPEKSDADKP